LPKRAAGPIAKLIKSAADNAKAGGVSGDDLKVKNIIVENAGVYVRYMPRAYGRASAIRRRRSRVKVELSEGAKKKAKTATP
jgi:large subunit ribosomal protein L22